MNNLLCCILFCIIALCLVNADCPPYPGIINATFNKEEECRDITIRCDGGFVMEQGMTCIDGKWKYQEPFCKPLECDYNFTNKTTVDFGSIGFFPSLNQTECNKRCNDDTRCSTTYLYENGYCYLYPAPVISRSKATDLDQCIVKCTQMKECLMLYHVGGRPKLCYMFNVTLSNLPDDFSVGNSFGNTVAEKICL